MGIYCGADDTEAAHQAESSNEYVTPATPSLLQSHYLNLLEQLISLKSTYQADPGREEWLLKAINSSAYSAFRSCIEHGAETEAKALLGVEHQAQ